MVFNLFGTSIRVSGEVRTLHGAVMGVAFAAMTEAEQVKLSNVLKRLADGRSTNSDLMVNTQAAVLRLERWFKTHDLLTRDLFHRIVDGQFDPATEAKVNPLMEKAGARFVVEEVAASMLGG